MLARRNLVLVLVDDAAFGLRHRRANRIGPIQLRREKPHMRHRRSFGHAVALANGNSGALR